MTRKDYILIAAALKAAQQDCSSDASLAGNKHTAIVLATALAQDNPRFDRDRFLKAAGAT